MGNLRVNAKFAIILGLSAVAVAVTVVVASIVVHSRMLNDRAAQLAAVVDSALSYAQSLDNEVQAGHLTRDDAIERARQFLPNPLRKWLWVSADCHVGRRVPA